VLSYPQVKARKLHRVTAISRPVPKERIPQEDAGALSYRVAGWALLGGIAWFLLANVLALKMQFGFRGFLAVEGIYVASVALILFLYVAKESYSRRLSDRRAERSSNAIVRCLAQVAALHDGDTASHCERIGALAYEVSIEMGLARESCELLRRAAVLHDLGKIGIDRAILLKPGPLSDAERSEVRRHVELGAALLQDADDPILSCALVAIKTHHEWWDGRGYPRGLVGNAIPMEGRIVAVCDVFDALASDRPYHPALEPEDALSVVRENAGAQFDPEIVAAFERCFPRMLDIYEPR
jgi:HD-GYP domain-containing protein (c-di-GMP phosphodiesterase class II)